MSKKWHSYNRVGVPYEQLKYFKLMLHYDDLDITQPIYAEILRKVLYTAEQRGDVKIASLYREHAERVEVASREKNEADFILVNSPKRGDGAKWNIVVKGSKRARKERIIRSQPGCL